MATKRALKRHKIKHKKYSVVLHIKKEQYDNIKPILKALNNTITEFTNHIDSKEKKDTTHSLLENSNVMPETIALVENLQELHQKYDTRINKVKQFMVQKNMIDKENEFDFLQFCIFYTIVEIEGMAIKEHQALLNI